MKITAAEVVIEAVSNYEPMPMPAPGTEAARWLYCRSPPN